MVPNPIGPDDCDRPGHTDLQAIGLGPLHAALCHDAQLLEPPLQELPTRLALLARTALLLFGNAAQEDVSLDPVATDLVERLCGLVELG